MNATAILALLLRYEPLIPVLLKYGPGILTALKTQEPVVMQFVADVKAALAANNPATWISLVTKYGQSGVAFIQGEGPIVLAFIKDIEAAMAGGASVPPGSLDLGALLQQFLKQLQSAGAAVGTPGATPVKFP